MALIAQMECSVVEIDRHGAKSSTAEPGDNVKIKLGGVDDWEQIESGFMLCHRATPMPFTTTFVAQVTPRSLNSHMPFRLQPLGELAVLTVMSSR